MWARDICAGRIPCAVLSPETKVLETSFSCPPASFAGGPRAVASTGTSCTPHINQCSSIRASAFNRESAVARRRRLRSCACVGEWGECALHVTRDCTTRPRRAAHVCAWFTLHLQFLCVQLQRANENAYKLSAQSDAASALRITRRVALNFIRHSCLHFLQHSAHSPTTSRATICEAPTQTESNLLRCTIRGMSKLQYTLKNYQHYYLSGGFVFEVSFNLSD